MLRRSILLLALAPASALPAALTITFAEQPVRLLRDTGFYVAGRGARLLNGDLLESAAASIQVDAGNASTVVIGPASRIYFKLDAKGPELILLGGWLKIQAGAVPIQVSAGGLQFGAANNSLILRSAPGKTELFVEEGEAMVDEAGKAPHPARVTREHYAVRSEKLPLKILPRAPKEFLGGMPPTFLDALVAVGVKGAAPTPKLERAASFADVAPWLAEQPALRQVLQRRFNPPKPAPVAPAAPAAPAARPSSQLY